MRARWAGLVVVCACSVVTDLTGLSSPDATPLDAPVDVSDDALDEPDAADAADAVDAAVVDSPCSDAGPAIVTGVGVIATVNNTLSAPLSFGPVVANDVIVVAAKINAASTISIGAIADEHGDTFTIPTQFKAAAFTHAIAYATVAQAWPSTTITVTLVSSADGGKANAVLYATKYSGLAMPAATDALHNMSASSGTVTSGTAATTFPHELIFGFGSSINAGIAAGPSFTAIASTQFGFIESRVVECSGTYEATGVIADAGTWVMLMATFPGN